MMSGPPAAWTVLICYILDYCSPDFILYVYANVMPHVVRVCSAGLSARDSAQGLVSSQVGENGGPRLGA